MSFIWKALAGLDTHLLKPNKIIIIQISLNLLIVLRLLEISTHIGRNS